MRLQRERSLLEWHGDVVIDGRDADAPTRAAGHDGDDLAAVTWDTRRRQWRVLAVIGLVALDGVALAFGASGALAVGMTLSIGRASLEVLDLTPPGALARDRRGGTTCVEHDGALVLPDEHAPELMLTEAPAGWVACALGPVPTTDARVDDRGTCVAGGRLWQIRLPRLGDLSSRWLAHLAHSRLRLARPGAESALELGGRALALPWREHHTLLRALAEARARSPGGWLGLDALAARGITAARLTVMRHRARHQLAARGVVDSDALFDERPDAVRLNPTLTVELAPG